MTVFLTTQYLEEADVLADRVGIIDHGRIVAEGTPAALKAERRAPDRRGGARRPGRSASALAAILAPLRRSVRLAARRRGAAPFGRDASSPAIVRALDAEGLKVEHLQLHQPTLDDVFLAKTGRSLEGAAEEEASDASGLAGAGRA